jgi:histidine triad (HIT) family protein
MDGCIFCKIVAGEIPADIVYRDGHVLAIADAHPQAPTHLLVMPLVHAGNLAQFLDAADAAAVTRLFSVAAKLGASCGQSGFRTVVNTGPQGGQTVEHLHVHVLAGRQMQWPPG